MTRHNPTDRSKLGSKRHILGDKEGIPLSTFITSANTHDASVAINTVDSMVIKRRQSYKLIDRNKRKKQNLCLDKAYHSKEVEKQFKKKHTARRWVVERINSWHNRFRKLFTRYEKKEENYLGLVQLANSLIVYRRLILG